MSTTAEKLTYLNGTKRLLRRRINSLGGNITLETRFRDYLLWLNRFYDAAASAFEFEIKGETRLRANSTSINLLPLYSGEIVTDGVTVTVSEGGKLTVSGTPTRTMWVKISNGMDVVYEEPTTTSEYQNHKWANETLLNFGEPTTFYFCRGIGGGTQPQTTITPSWDLYCRYYPDLTSYNSYYGGELKAFVNSNFDEKQITMATEITAEIINCIYIRLEQNVSYNLYGYFEVSTSPIDPNSNPRPYWEANRDAAPPSPENPKEIINKTGDVTYTSKDGLRDFTVSLGDGSPYRSVPNAGYDSITYKDGKFYNIRKTWDASLSSSNWEYYAQYNGIYRKSFNSINSKSAVCNYFENVVNNAIVDFQTASDNLQHGQFALVEDNGDTYIYIKDTDFTESGDTATQFSNWVDSLYPTNIRVIYVGDESSWIEQEITENWFSTLYPQLNAIKDYEVQCIIEDKVF